MSEMRQQAEDGDGSIEIQSGGEADRGQQCEQFRERDLQDVEHWVVGRGPAPQTKRPLPSFVKEQPSDY